MPAADGVLSLTVLWEQSQNTTSTFKPAASPASASTPRPPAVVRLPPAPTPGPVRSRSPGVARAAPAARKPVPPGLEPLAKLEPQVRATRCHHDSRMWRGVLGPHHSRGRGMDMRVPARPANALPRAWRAQVLRVLAKHGSLPLDQLYERLKADLSASSPPQRCGPPFPAPLLVSPDTLLKRARDGGAPLTPRLALAGWTPRRRSSSSSWPTSLRWARW